MTALDDARRQAEEALAKWDHDPDFMADNCIQPLRALIAAAQRAEAALALIASRDCCCPAWLDQPCDGCRARAALAGGAAPPPRLPQPERGGE